MNYRFNRGYVDWLRRAIPCSSQRRAPMSTGNKPQGRYPGVADATHREVADRTRQHIRPEVSTATHLDAVWARHSWRGHGADVGEMSNVLQDRPRAILCTHRTGALVAVSIPVSSRTSRTTVCVGDSCASAMPPGSSQFRRPYVCLTNRTLPFMSRTTPAAAVARCARRQISSIDVLLPTRVKGTPVERKCHNCLFVRGRTVRLTYTAEVRGEGGYQKFPRLVAEERSRDASGTARGRVRANHEQAAAVHVSRVSDCQGGCLLIAHSRKCLGVCRTGGRLQPWILVQSSICWTGLITLGTAIALVVCAFFVLIHGYQYMTPRWKCSRGGVRQGQSVQRVHRAGDHHVGQGADEPGRQRSRRRRNG